MNSNIENLTLSECFDLACPLIFDLEKSCDSSSKNDHEKWKKSVVYMDKCLEMLDELHLFSDNETIDEISSNELRYFLCPVFLAWLLTQSFENKSRRINLERAKLNYLKFFKLTKEYDMHNYTLPNNEAFSNKNPSNSTSQQEFDQNLVTRAHDRNEKIRRFKEQKKMKKDLDIMREYYVSGNMEDEQKREFHMKLINYWLNKSLDDLKILLDELRLLSKHENVEIKAEGSELKSDGARPAMKPYIITRDSMQAQVFGLGYPSLPVYSIDQFYDQLCDKGMMPSDTTDDGKQKKPVIVGGGVTDSQKEQDKVDKEVLHDNDDEEELKKQREWDDWKDDNKRGIGNRYNRS